MHGRRTAWSIGLAPLLALACIVWASGCAERKSDETGAAPAADAASESSDAVAEQELAAGEPEPAPEPVLDPDAVEVLRAMVKSLAESKALRVHVEEEFDAIQRDGETLTFGKMSDLTMRRPDRLRVETSVRAGARRVTTYDGKQLVVHDTVRNVYAKVERPGDLDSVVDYLRDEIGMKMPLAPLFSTQLGPLLLEGVTAATFVDEEQLDGVDLDHIAFAYGEGIGVQLWIPAEGDALPRRMVITFEDAPGRPQFRADFREWQLTPDVADGVFAFQAPAGARSVPFVLPKRVVMPGGEGS